MKNEVINGVWLSTTHREKKASDDVDQTSERICINLRKVASFAESHDKLYTVVTLPYWAEAINIPYDEFKAIIEGIKIYPDQT